MNLLKRLLWLWRVSQGIGEVEQLAEEHTGNPEYRIQNANDALSIFLEYSSQRANLAETTEAEGEIICEMFVERWDRSGRLSTFADL